MTTALPRRQFDLRNSLIAITCVVAGLSAFLLVRLSHPTPPELDVKSNFSHIRIRRDGNERTLIFVRDNGYEAVESRVDVSAPHRLLLPYSQTMFASYLYQPKQERVLIIGLGGGAMVHFLQKYDPAVKVDAVEIDPVVVDLADKYFDVRTQDNVHIITMDGFEYLATCEHKYNTIYMDAFLRPSDDTDEVGIPERLKTTAFYRSMQERLAPGGIVVFNLNRHLRTDDDIAAIRESFAAITVFHCRPANNIIVVARTTDEPMSPDAIQSRARELDDRFRAEFSFRRIVSNIQP